MADPSVPSYVEQIKAAFAFAVAYAKANWRAILVGFGLGVLASLVL